MNGNRKKGNAIETEASAYLCREGYEILARNYAYRGGELDIVARDGKTVVFVEVKSVWTTGQGNPAARVNALKQRKIWNTACHFLMGGATGSGKSNLLHNIILSVAFRYSPEELEFYLMDLKDGVEFTLINEIPEVTELNLKFMLREIYLMHVWWH